MSVCSVLWAVCLLLDHPTHKHTQEISKDTASGVEVKLRGTALNALVGYVSGPKDTPYDGGRHVD